MALCVLPIAKSKQNSGDKETSISMDEIRAIVSCMLYKRTYEATSLEEQSLLFFYVQLQSPLLQNLNEESCILEWELDVQI